MATMPPNPNTPPMPDMGQEPASEAAEAPGGYTICIRVGADGQLSVGTEQESAEEAAEEYAGFKPAANIKEALTTALDIFKADGQMPDDGGDADFNGGFQSRGPSSYA